MTFKSAMSTIGTGLVATATVIHNSPINEEIREIENQIKELEERKTQLQTRLID